MSSRRFPGKVLAPFRGRPIIRHVVDAARAGLPGADVVVVTSDAASDDPLASYVATLGVPVYRGTLDDVLGRYAGALAAHPADWILRVCADSPLFNPSVPRALADAARDVGQDADLVTTTAKRTLPKGHNAELIRSSSLRTLAAREGLSDADREHVTPALHREGRVVNVASTGADLSDINLCIDTVDDLTRLERLPEGELAALGSYRLAAARVGRWA